MAKPTQLPRWATGVSAVIAPEPTEGKKDLGWTVGEKPPRQYQNWWMRRVYEWCLYLDGLANEAFTWAAKHTFAAGLRLSDMADPGAPADGDVWRTGSALKARLGGATHTLATRESEDSVDVVPSAANVLGTVYVRRTGKTVTVYGFLHGISANVAVDGVLATIPAGYRPAAAYGDAGALAVTVNGAAYSSAQGLNAVRVVRDGQAGAGELRWMGPTAFGGLLQCQFALTYRCA
jgi:hypothetical protein